MKKTIMPGRLVVRTFQYLLCAVITVFTVFPVLFIIFTSFKTQSEYFKGVWSLPSSLYLDNFAYVLNSDFPRYFLNSILVCAASVFFIILCATMMSYAITKIRFKGASIVFFIIMIGMMIPVHTTLIPIYVMSKELGLYNSLFALIGPYVSFGIPVSTIIISQFFREIPHEIEESATMDGCGHLRLYGQIIVPLARPAVATVTVYCILQTWNEFIYAMTLIDSKNLKTLPVGLKDFYGVAAVNIPAVMCAVLISVLPVMIVYFLAQEQVINGLTQGAVKG